MWWLHIFLQWIQHVDFEGVLSIPHMIFALDEMMRCRVVISKIKMETSYIVIQSSSGMLYNCYRFFIWETSPNAVLKLFTILIPYHAMWGSFELALKYVWMNIIHIHVNSNTYDCKIHRSPDKMEKYQSIINKRS